MIKRTFKIHFTASLDFTNTHINIILYYCPSLSETKLFPLRVPYMLISSIITRKTPMISFIKDHKGIHYVLLLLAVLQNNHKLCTFHLTDVHSSYRFPSVLYRENHLLFHLDQSDQYNDKNFLNIHQRPFFSKGTADSAFCVLIGSIFICSLPLVF